MTKVEERAAFNQLTKLVNKKIHKLNFDDDLERSTCKCFLLSSLLIDSPEIYQTYSKEQQSKSEALIKEYASACFSNDNAIEFYHSLRERVVKADFMPLLFNTILVMLLDAEIKIKS